MYYHSNCWNVNITGYNNFSNIIKNEAITHSRRRKTLYKHFINSKKSLLYNYLKSIAEGINTSYSLSKRLNLSQITTTYYLRKFRKEEYIKKITNYKNRAYNYTLTLKGSRILEFYSKIEKEST